MTVLLIVNRVLILLVVNRVLMRVSVGREARRGSEEVLKGADVDCRVKYLDREKSRQRRGGGSERGGGGCNDGWGNVLERDVLE